MSTNPTCADATNQPAGEAPSSPPDAHRPHTPPNAETSLESRRDIEDTPATLRETRSHAYQNGDLASMRDRVLCELNYKIPEVDTTEFVQYLIPPLKSGLNVKKIVSTLKSEGFVTPGNKWKQYETSPRNQKTDEDTVFSAIEDICKDITQQASLTAPSLQQTFILYLLPHVTPKSDKASSTRPDGYFILKGSSECDRTTTKQDGDVLWYDIALTAEFKKREADKDRNDNVSKVMFNMQQTMTLDPCRRFTFGITIENTELRLWFCSRSIAIVSKPFDFTSETHLLTHIFLSFAYASKEELGWDPTIRPWIVNNGPRAYHIDVGGQTFKTEQVFAEFSADALLSRATRVWRAKLLGSDDQFVLKDVWVEDDRELEYDIYKRMLRDIEEKYGKDIRKEAESHLLTPYAHWVVPVNGEEDHTTKVMMRGFTSSFVNGLNLKHGETTKKDGKKSAGPSAASDKEVKSSRQALVTPFPKKFELVRRRHYRIVFKESACALFTLRNLSDVFVVLSDSAKVLEWIHGCGWVHRDIGVFNLYLYEGRGLIGDLEYAKRKDSDIAHKVRTANSDCMANEAIIGAYRFIPPDEGIMSKLMARLNSTEEDTSNEQNSDHSDAFFHNDLHDLESLWWAAVWEFFFYRVSSETDKDIMQSAVRDENRTRVALRLFPKTDNITDHMGLLGTKGGFTSMIGWLSESLTDIKGHLESLRSLLVFKYNAFEAQLPAIKLDVFQVTHKYFAQTFRRCADLVNRDSIKLIPYKTTGDQYSLPVGHIAEENQDVFAETAEDQLDPEDPEIGILIGNLALEDDDVFQ